MLKVHHLGLSQSERIVWLCEELGIDYDLIRYDRDPPMQAAPPEYKALHPAGTAPVIDDGGVVLAESDAIVDYLLAKHDANGALSLRYGDPAFADYVFWLRFANGSFLPRGMFQMIASAMGAPAGGSLSDRSGRAYEMAEKRLGEAAYFGGERFSAADIMMVFGLTTMRLFAPRDIAPYPNIRAYLQRIGERPAYQAAMAKAEPGMAPVLG